MVLSLKGCGGRGETPRCPRPKRELEEERFYDAFTRRSRAPASARRVSLTSYELYCISRQCREIDDGTKAGASVKACRFVARRSPGGPHRVGIRHVQAPTAHARALPSMANSLSQPSGWSPSPPSLGSRALWRAPRTGACGIGDHPTPDLSQSTTASRSASEKSK